MLKDDWKNLGFKDEASHASDSKSSVEAWAFVVKFSYVYFVSPINLYAIKIYYSCLKRVLLYVYWSKPYTLPSQIFFFWSGGVGGTP
jgi:hypothetical protein